MSTEAENYCASLPTFQAEVAEGASGNDKKVSYSLTLKPVPAVDGTDQYWPLFNSGSPSEEFGNMLFKFNGVKGGQITLVVTLDTSAVSDAQFVNKSGNQDGIFPLNTIAKHDFKSKIVSQSGGTQLEITVKTKDDEDSEETFSFLWLCQSVALGGQFKSGDPNAKIEPL